MSKFSLVPDTKEILSGIKTKIDSGWDGVQKSKVEFIASAMNLASALLEARNVFKDNGSFSKWLDVEGFGPAGARPISRNDRSALLNMARDPEKSIAVLETTARRSFQHIWRDEFHLPHREEDEIEPGSADCEAEAIEIVEEIVEVVEKQDRRPTQTDNVPTQSGAAMAPQTPAKRLAADERAPMRLVEAQGTAALKAAVEGGELSPHLGAQIATLDKVKQRKILSMPADAREAAVLKVSEMVPLAVVNAKVLTLKEQAEVNERRAVANMREMTAKNAKALAASAKVLVEEKRKNASLLSQKKARDEELKDAIIIPAKLNIAESGILSDKESSFDLNQSKIDRETSAIRKLAEAVKKSAQSSSIAWINSFKDIRILHGMVKIEEDFLIDGKSAKLTTKKLLEQARSTLLIAIMSLKAVVDDIDEHEKYGKLIQEGRKPTPDEKKEIDKLRYGK